MIGAVTLGWTARVSPTVLGIARRETSQTVGGQQVFLNLFHHRLCAFSGQHAVRQTDREYLVRTNRSIRWPAVYSVVQAAGFLVPEQTIEAPARHGRHVSVTLLPGLVTEFAGQIFH